MSTVDRFMPQQVNLYLPEFQPRNDWMTAQRLLLLLAGVAVLSALLASIDYGRRYLLQQELTESSAALTEQTRITEQIERSLAGRATDPRLLEEIATREANLAQLQSTLEILSTLSLGNLNGFSEHLKNLSQASMEGLWLTDIEIMDGGSTATLQGFAEDSAMVSSFVERLSAGWTRSQGWRFNRFSGGVVTEELLAAAESSGATEAGANTTNRIPLGLNATLYQFQLEAN
ncbi:MAG: PilN domain-containing protein [Pseudomonadales bacterium]|nr:PilN domain-containing protein [Pseudomonadales bacterium]